MARLLFLMSLLALLGCSREQFSGYPIPLFPSSGSSRGYPTAGPVPIPAPISVDRSPIEPRSDPPAIEQRDVNKAAPPVLGLVSPLVNQDDLHATEGAGSEASVEPLEAAPVAEPPVAEKASPPAHPQDEAPPPSSQLTTEESERPGEQPDVVQRLQEIKKELNAQNGQTPPERLVPQASSGPQPAASWLPTRPGFHDHYGGLNHSGDMPIHEPVSP